MTQRRRRDVRTINAWVAGVAISAGLGVALAGPSPTGSTIVDAVLLFVSTAVCVLCVATARWTDRWGESSRPILAALVFGLVVQVVSRLGNVWRFGLSAGLAIVPILAITLVAVHRRAGRRRILMWSAFGGLVIAGTLALVGLGVAAAAARPALTRGVDEAQRALDSLENGDLDAARQGFQLAAALLDDASNDLDAPWAQPARLIPVVAQHRRAAVELAESAASVSNTISDVLGQVDLDRLRIVNGSIDIAAITALRDPLDHLNTALADLDTTVDSVDSQWLLQPIRSRLATFTDQIDKQQRVGDRVSIAVQRAPAMLGANGKRVYFIAFTTPSEARGLGGLMDSWAEVTFDNGQLAVTGFGRAVDLAVNGDSDHWTHITSSPNFPEVAKLIADGYATSSGHVVDGVFAMDVYTVAALMKLTGPIDLTTTTKSVTADNAAKFLLSDQYTLVQDRPGRIDLFVEVAGTTIARLLSSSLPAPPDLIELLSPFAQQGRLVGWSAKADEEDLFERMRMSGELPKLDGNDGLAVVMDNIGVNKIDYYLTGEVSYSVDTDPTSGTASATLDIVLHNNAPAGVTEPASVFANSVGAPPGTNRLGVTVYSALPVTGVSGDGQPRPSSPLSGDIDTFHLTSVSVDIPAQSSARITLQLAGQLDLADGYHAIIRNQASVKAMVTTVVVDGVATQGSPYRKSGTIQIDGGA